MKKIGIFIISLLFIIIGITTPLNALGHANTDTTRSNLPKNYSNRDSIRLEQLYQSVKRSFSIEEERDYIDELLKEADSLNNHLYTCKAYLSYMYLAYNSLDTNEVDVWMKKLEPLARKERYYDILFLGKRCVVDMYIVKEEYELHQREANRMLQEAKKLNNTVGIAVAIQSLSNGYRSTYKDKEAAKLLDDNYATALKAGNNLELEASNSLIQIYSSLKDTVNWIKWIKIQDKTIKNRVKNNPESKEMLKIWSLMTYIGYLEYYNAISNTEKAYKYLNLAEEYYFGGYGTISAPYRLARLYYFDKKGLWDNALEEVNNMLDIYKEAPMSYISSVFMKAKILRKAGRCSEALAIYDQAFLIKDSLQHNHIQTQLEQLKSDYKASELLLERKKIDNKKHLFILAVIIIATILLIYVVVHILKTRAKLRKSEREMQIMSEEMEIANLAKENFLSTIRLSIDAPLKEIVNKALHLSSDEINKEHREGLSKELSTNANELMKLINNILDLSRLEAGMMKLKISDVDILLLLRNTISSKDIAATQIVSTLKESDTVIKSIDTARFAIVIKSLLERSESSNNIVLEIDITTDKKLTIVVKGSLLAIDPRAQNHIIANEINRMTIEQFGGSYKIISDTSAPYIIITL